MTADLIGKAIRARLHARQEFIDWRAAVVVFGPGKCEECLMKNLFFEGHQKPSNKSPLDGLLGRVVAELKRSAATDETLSVVRAAKCLAFHEDLRDRAFLEEVDKSRS